MPTTRPADPQSDLFGLPECPTVADALGDLPNADRYPTLLNTDSVKAKWGVPSEYARLLRGIDLANDDYSYPRVWDPSILTSSFRTLHTEKSVRRFEGTKPGEVESISRFLRLDPDGWCNTLRAGTDGKRGAYTSPRPIHPRYNRVITVREAARLHGFPDWFRFHRTKWHGFRQVGNAVIPHVGKAVGKTIIRAMALEPSRPTAQVELGSPTLLELTMGEAADHFGVPRDVVGNRDR